MGLSGAWVECGAVSGGVECGAVSGGCVGGVWGCEWEAVSGGWSVGL